MARSPDGPPPPPAVQRLRLRYAKRGRLRFSCHRDFQRALERALRRAAVPMAYSAGFSPHPKISYANAAPTGVASEAEYVEIAVTERCDPERLRAALDASLPPGLDVLEVVEAGPGALADRLEASVYQVELPRVDVRAGSGRGGHAAGCRAGRGGADDQDRSATVRRPGGPGPDHRGGRRVAGRSRRNR